MSLGFIIIGLLVATVTTVTAALATNWSWGALTVLYVGTGGFSCLFSFAWTELVSYLGRKERVEE